MPEITCWSRSSECSGRGTASSSLSVRRVGPGLRPERLQRRLGLEPVQRQQLDPGGLLGAELAQAQLSIAGEPDQHARGAVLHRRALLVDHHPARRHQVHEQRQRPERVGLGLEQEQLPAPAHVAEDGAVQRAQRRVERLEHVDPRRHHRLDRLAGQRRGQAAGDDLHLGQLGHERFTLACAGHGSVDRGGGGRDRAPCAARAGGARGGVLALRRRPRRERVRFGVRGAGARRGHRRARPVLLPGTCRRPRRPPARQRNPARTAARPRRHGRRARSTTSRSCGPARSSSAPARST